MTGCPRDAFHPTGNHKMWGTAHYGGSWEMRRSSPHDVPWRVAQVRLERRERRVLASATAHLRRIVQAVIGQFAEGGTAQRRIRRVLSG